MKHFATTKHQPEQQDDAALFSRRNVELARAHLATMAPERRAQRTVTSPTTGVWRMMRRSAGASVATSAATSGMGWRMVVCTG